jgi:hypothetical protein
MVLVYSTVYSLWDSIYHFNPEDGGSGLRLNVQKTVILMFTAVGI